MVNGMSFATRMTSLIVVLAMALMLCAPAAWAEDEAATDSTEQGVAVSAEGATVESESEPEITVASSEDEDASAVSDAAVATVGETSYATLEEAFTAANSSSGTVALCADAQLASTVSVTGNVTLNLSTYTLDIYSYPITVASGGSLTVQGSGVVTTTEKTGETTAFIVSSGGTLSITGGDYTNLLSPYSVSGTLSISGGQFYSAVSSSYCASGYLPVSVTAGSTTYYSVDDSVQMNFLGNSFRLDGYSNESYKSTTDYRYGYEYQVASGKTASISEVGWNYGTTASLGKTLAASKSRANSGTEGLGYSTVSNIVFTNIKLANYSKNIYVRMYIKYTKDSDTSVVYTVNGTAENNTVLATANAITSSTTASTIEKNYASALKRAEDETHWTGYY